MESRREEQEIASLHVIEQIARMTNSHEHEADGRDAIDTLDLLIAKARSIVHSDPHEAIRD